MSAEQRSWVRPREETNSGKATADIIFSRQSAFYPHIRSSEDTSRCILLSQPHICVLIGRRTLCSPLLGLSDDRGYRLRMLDTPSSCS